MLEYVIQGHQINGLTRIPMNHYTNSPWPHLPVPRGYSPTPPDTEIYTIAFSSPLRISMDILILN